MSNRSADREEVQACVVCGRYFIRRKDRVCSITCAEVAKQNEDRKLSAEKDHD
jgi:predicted nucleic acid-binding Zn ribbon protein